MKRLYLILAVIGAILPYFYFAQFFASDGVNLPAFLAAAVANPVASGFTADLLVSSPVFWILMAAEKRRNPGAPGPALFVALNLLVGLSCALPAWLYAREAGDFFS
ncbi:MAG: DUF2834 domain-containing protein [Chloroflexi bacterium]|nr:DUF2834 domain-containing protein [Chloroflexota bacterium]